MALSLQEPVLVVILDELCDCDSCLVDCPEAVEVKKLFLKCPMESFDDAVTLGTADKGW